MRLIDADAISADIHYWLDNTDDDVVYIDRTELFDLIDDAPTIEPKRGEWIDKGWKGDWQFETDGRGNCWYEYECSECGFRNKGGKSNFCPNCGADMRGKGDD